MKYRILFILILFFSFDVSALPTCTYGFDGEDCGYGAVTCSPGYHVQCTHGACEGSGSCSEFNCPCVVDPCNPTTQHTQDIYQVNYGTNLKIKERCVCKKVTNNSPTGLAIMIPAKTAGEWSNFYNNLPSGVTTTNECP